MPSSLTDITNILEEEEEETAADNPAKTTAALLNSAHPFFYLTEDCLFLHRIDAQRFRSGAFFADAYYGKQLKTFEEALEEEAEEELPTSHRAAGKNERQPQPGGENTSSTVSKSFFSGLFASNAASAASQSSNILQLFETHLPKKKVRSKANQPDTAVQKAADRTTSPPPSADSSAGASSSAAGRSASKPRTSPEDKATKTNDIRQKLGLDQRPALSSTSSSSSSSSSSASTDSASKVSSSLNSTMSNNRALASQNLDRMKRMEDKSQSMADAAKANSDAARKLKEKMKAQNSGWGFW
jgi:hypothetical protein